ncbi:MAG TPA: sigma-54 dependent transcriptional regulator [Terriglobales bacterium]|jgi:DNA-binding NtrC family response regulator
MNQVLIVDDDAGMRTALDVGFRRRGWSVETASGTGEALAKFRRRQHALVVTDIRMPDRDGFAVMRGVRELASNTAVILLTAFASVPDAVEAMKGGACDYLVKPISFERLEEAASRILARTRPTDDSLVGRSPAWLRALERARKAAATDADILIQAESGTGKEVLARMIHAASPRRDRPFVAVNCAAFPETLLESELFGHNRGAFTGAIGEKPGKFELAHGGTLLLDEVAEIPLSLQPKLLRALQEREFDRLGSTRSVKVDIRVIATTNRFLEQMIQAGSFRTDLFYRLNVIPLGLPPLRERGDDMLLMAEHFARMYAAPDRPVRLSAEFREQLRRHSWPGNVRELINLIRRVVALAPGNEIGPEAWTDFEPIAPDCQADRLEPGLSLVHVEKRLFELTLEATGGNRSRAAEMLGVSLRTVRNKVRDYGLPSRRSYGHE